MAKSLRSKVKQAAGRKRRSDSHYAVAESARIQRLSDKLLAASKEDKEKAKTEDGEADAAAGADAGAEDTKMEGDAAPEGDAKVSTAGPRGSRREEWRKSKGMGKRESRVKSGVNGGSRSFKPKRRR